MDADSWNEVRFTMSQSQLQVGLGGPLTKFQSPAGSIHGYEEYQNAVCGFCVLQTPVNEVNSFFPMLESGSLQ